MDFPDEKIFKPEIFDMTDKEEKEKELPLKRMTSPD